MNTGMSSGMNTGMNNDNTGEHRPWAGVDRLRPRPRRAAGRDRGAKA